MIYLVNIGGILAIAGIIWWFWLSQSVDDKSV